MDLETALQLVGEAVSEYAESLYEDEELIENADEVYEAWEVVQDHINWEEDV